MPLDISAEYTIKLPVLHTGQVAAYRVTQKNRLTAIRCGRRFGKTDLLKTLACDKAAKGRNVGFFAPDFKIQAEAYAEIVDILEPIKKSASETKGVIRTITGGRIDFWTLNNERAGRSRAYHLALIDEAAFTDANMMAIWEQAIQPTLLDYDGRAVAASNTNGINPDNFFWQICNEPRHGWAEYHAPTSQNPHLPRRLPGETEESHAARRLRAMEDLRKRYAPLVYQQEVLAEFVDWSGVAFFAKADLLGDDGEPVEPGRVDVVFAVIDTATKTGREHDGTAVAYCGYAEHPRPQLTILDWDIAKIEGSLLEAWLPSVFHRLEELSREGQARSGSIGAFIEDKASGTILLQQARRRDLPAQSIDSKLTALGKDERAISVSGYVYRKMVKISRAAYDKVTIYNDVSRNHFLSQVLGYRVGVKDQEDDLLDTFCYATSLALGDVGGF